MSESTADSAEAADKKKASEARAKEIRYRWMERELKRIRELLDLANVPQNVTHGDVLANAPHCRLRWFIMRRKDVKASEAVGCYSDLELMLMTEDAANPRETDEEELERGEDFV